MIKTYHSMWLNATGPNWDMLEVLQFNGADIRVFHHGFAVQFPIGTRQIGREEYKQNVEGIEMRSEHLIFEVPSGTQFRYMRRVTEEPVGIDDTLIIRQSKVVLNRSRNLQEA